METETHSLNVKQKSDADFIRILHAAKCLMDGRSAQAKAYHRILTMFALHVPAFPSELTHLYLSRKNVRAYG